MAKIQHKNLKSKFGNGIIGVLQLFVIASIAYTTTVIVMGTDGLLPVVLAIPQAFWASVVLVKQFTK